MVISFMEESVAIVERPPRGRCNCFNSSNYEESDDGRTSSSPPALPSRLPARRGRQNPGGSQQGSGVGREPSGAKPSRRCVPVAERCGKSCKGKVQCDLTTLGYDATVCKSCWGRRPPIQQSSRK